MTWFVSSCAPGAVPAREGGERRAGEFAEKITSLDPQMREGRRRLDHATNLFLGDEVGAAYSVAALKCLRGQRAVNTVFGAVYSADVLLNTALGLYHPTRWSAKDLAIDLLDKYVQAQATRRLRPRAGPEASEGHEGTVRPPARGPAAPGRRECRRPRPTARAQEVGEQDAACEAVVCGAAHLRDRN